MQHAKAQPIDVTKQYAAAENEDRGTGKATGNKKGKAKSEAKPKPKAKVKAKAKVVPATGLPTFDTPPRQAATAPDTGDSGATPAKTGKCEVLPGSSKCRFKRRGCGRCVAGFLPKRLRL